MLLSEVTKSRIFLDSDDVSKLDAIIDAPGQHFQGLKRGAGDTKGPY